MSKLGAHITIGNHGSGENGIGAAMRACYDAGSPVPIVLAVDQNFMPTITDNSPTGTGLIFRTQIDGNDNPPQMYQADAIETANWWYSQCIGKWRQNPAHAYAPSNERNPAIDAHHVWCDQFDHRLLELAEADGLRLALHGDSVGTPDYPAWNYYQLSLSHAAAGKHLLLLHEYGLDGTLQQSAPHLALRYRQVHNLIEPFAPGLRIVIGEASGGAGYAGQGQAWLNDMIWYDSELMRDPYVIGCCMYQLGGAENWFQLIPQWRDYVMTHPTPTQPPEPPPVDEWEFVGHFNADTGALITNTLDYEFDLMADVSIDTRYQKKAPPLEVYTFSHKVTPPELAARVSVTPMPGTYPRGQRVRIVAS